MDQWTPLAAGRSPRTYAPGQMIYLQGTQADQFYYILSGTVKCFLSSAEGDERTLTLHRSGDQIGEAAFFDRQPRVSFAVAVSRCVLVYIDRPWLESVFAQHPDLAVSMLEYLARTVRLLSAHVDGAFRFPRDSPGRDPHQPGPQRLRGGRVDDRLRRRISGHVGHRVDALPSRQGRGGPYRR